MTRSFVRHLLARGETPRERLTLAAMRGTSLFMAGYVIGLMLRT